MIFLTQAALLRDDSQPLTHARIGYENLARDATIIASSAASGFPAGAAKNPDTYTYWQPASLPATWAIDTGAAASVDYVAIAAHDLGTQACTLYVEYSEDQVSWTEFADVMPGSDKPFMILGDVVTARYWRLRVTGINDAPKIGVVYIGQALAMQRAIYGGVTPPLTPNVDIRPNISAGGQYLNTSIRRLGQSFGESWQHLEADWYRTNFVPFINEFIRYPAFIAWRPASFQNEVVYIWSNGNLPEGKNMGIRNFMEVSISGEGFGASPHTPEAL